MTQQVPLAPTKASTCSIQEDRYTGVRHRRDMSYFLCLRLRGRSETFSHHGARQKAERLGTELHGEVLLDLKARETSDGRSAITGCEPDNPQVLRFPPYSGPHLQKSKYPR